MISRMGESFFFLKARYTAIQAANTTTINSARKSTLASCARGKQLCNVIYTTNIIEGLNRQFRQITKNKPSFTNDDSLRRMLYLASQRIVKHWHARCQNWDLVLSQLEIMFADRAVS